MAEQATDTGPVLSGYQIDRGVLADAAQQAGESATPTLPEETITAKAPVLLQDTAGLPAGTALIDTDDKGNAKVKAPNGLTAWIDRNHEAVKVLRDMEVDGGSSAPTELSPDSYGFRTFVDKDGTRVNKDGSPLKLNAAGIKAQQEMAESDRVAMYADPESVIGDTASGTDPEALKAVVGYLPPKGASGAQMDQFLAAFDRANMLNSPRGTPTLTASVQPSLVQPATVTNSVDNSAMGGRGPAPVPELGGSGYQPSGQVITPSGTGGGNQAGSPASLATLAQTQGAPGGGGQGPMPLPTPELSAPPIVPAGGAPAPAAPVAPVPLSQDEQAQVDERARQKTLRDNYYGAVNQMALSDFNTANERQKAIWNAAHQEQIAAQMQETRDQLTNRNWQQNMMRAQRQLEALGDVKEDPNRFFKSLSVPGQLSALVSVGLGAIGQALTGQNGSPIQTMIDRDIAAQREDFHHAITVNEQQRSLYGQMRTAGYSDHEATYLVSMKQTQAAMAAQNAMVSQYSPPEVKQRAAIQAQQLQQSYDQAAQKFAISQADLAKMQTAQKMADIQLDLAQRQKTLMESGKLMSPATQALLNENQAYDSQVDSLLGTAKNAPDKNTAGSAYVNALVQAGWKYEDAKKDWDALSGGWGLTSWRDAMASAVTSRKNQHDAFSASISGQAVGLPKKAKQ